MRRAQSPWRPASAEESFEEARGVLRRMAVYSRWRWADQPWAASA